MSGSRRDPEPSRDPLHARFDTDGLTPTTYARGNRRIDFILVDSLIAPAIKRIGTLGLHEGIFSDHVMLYMDCDEKELFKGIVNRPVMHSAREFVIEHADKCKRFVDKFRELAKEKNFAERTTKLAANFREHGVDADNLNTFHVLDTEIMECMLSAASLVAKKKFGYQRSRNLTRAGLELHFWKAVRSAKTRKASLGSKQVDRAATLDIDLDEVGKLTKRETRVKICEAKAKLWAVQKNATDERIEWLETNAQDIAKAAGEVDWEKKMKSMAAMAKMRAVNRKMTTAIKGPRRGLDHIEIPKYEWFYSNVTKEIYRYTKGVFEAYAAYSPQPGLQPTNPTKFYSHHHLKVIPEDAVRAEISRDGDYYHLGTIHPPAISGRTSRNPRKSRK